MSYHDLQRATLTVIRYPDQAASPEGLAELLTPYDLSDRERRQIEQLALDPTVLKFGRNMSTIRRDVAFAGAPLTRRLYGVEPLRAAYDMFDQSVMRVTLNEIAFAFLEFLFQQVVGEESGDEASDEACPWAHDVVAYEHRQAELRCYRPPVPRHPAAGAALRHGDYRVLHLTWNIPAWEQKARVTHPDVPIAPQAEPGWYLLLKSSSADDVKAFAIDEHTARYLIAERQHPGSVPRPVSYADLAGVGLVYADGPALPRSSVDAKPEAL